MKNVTNNTINQKKKRRKERTQKPETAPPLDSTAPWPPPVPAKPSTAPQKSAPPLPPPPLKGMSAGPAKVRKVPVVVEFCHSLMRRDSRRDSGTGATEAGKTRATPPAVGEMNQRRRRRRSDEGAMR
ncbi:hypothetical protein ACOSP7_005223 [Xanthoceras sorbifolium]